MPQQAPTDTQAASVRAASAPDASTLVPGLRLLPRDIRTDVYRLYDVLRTLDDLVDEDRPQAGELIDVLERWAHNEQADSPETRVLTDLSARYPLSPEPLAELCKAMRDDMARTVIESEDDVERYCQRVGGAVAIMLTQLLGSTHPDGEAKMATLGRAVQRTNILRDIDEDGARGRVYIARSTIERFGPPTPGDREELLRDQIARADALYEEASGATGSSPRAAMGWRSVPPSTGRSFVRSNERASGEGPGVSWCRPGERTCSSPDTACA